MVFPSPFLAAVQLDTRWTLYYTINFPAVYVPLLFFLSKLCCGIAASTAATVKNMKHRKYLFIVAFSHTKIAFNWGETHESSLNLISLNSYYLSCNFFLYEISQNESTIDIFLLDFFFSFRLFKNQKDFSHKKKLYFLILIETTFTEGIANYIDIVILSTFISFLDVTFKRETLSGTSYYPLPFCAFYSQWGFDFKKKISARSANEISI